MSKKLYLKLFLVDYVTIFSKFQAGALVTGNLEFYPSDGLLSAAGRSLCTETHPVMPEICSNVIFLACGFDSQQLNKVLDVNVDSQKRIIKPEFLL